MKYFLAVLVASVFLGTETLALSTPVAQLTIYRVVALAVPLIIAYSFTQYNEQLKIKKNSYATISVAIYVFWWLWGVFSVLWVENLSSWLQAVFLLTLGISSVLALYLWVDSSKTWKFLVKVSWVMMSLLMLLGYYEIITNHYLFANLEKLDRYNTFISEPFSRIPITHFANQNDFATMLLAYITISIILYYLTSNAKRRIIYIIGSILGTYLIYRSESRMSLASLFLYLFLLFILKYKWDINRKQTIAVITLFLIVLVGSVLFVPQVQNALDSLIYLNKNDIVTGDTGRVNLLRNGIIFLGATFGMGVGAGNIETWMGDYRFLPTNNIVNIHNWWGEILVGYGVLIFILYSISYALLVYRLFQMRKIQSRQHRNVTNQFIAFLTIYIFASMTSANNMLIEWHWVFFGLIISYIKLCESKLTIQSTTLTETRKDYEFKHSIK